MAKADIHPAQHKSFIKLNDGNKIEITTSHGKEGEVIILDQDPTNHAAWQDGSKNVVNANNARITKFNQKFGDFKFGGKKEDK